MTPKCLCIYSIRKTIIFCSKWLMVVIFIQIRGQIKLQKLNTQFKVIDPNIHEILHTEQYYEPNHQYSIGHCPRRHFESAHMVELYNFTILKITSNSSILGLNTIKTYFEYHRKSINHQKACLFNRLF